jgi:predicted transcriptional regulator of viral defense system
MFTREQLLLLSSSKPPISGGSLQGIAMKLTTRSLSPQESRVVLALTERKRQETTRAEIVELLGGSLKAADHVIEGLRRKGWLERAAWGEYLLVPPEQGPDALGDSNLLARASRIADLYYIGYGSAAAHYGLTTQHRSVIFVCKPMPTPHYGAMTAELEALLRMHMTIKIGRSS